MGVKVVLGDKHNFNQTVWFDPDRRLVFKPRSVHWERQLLSANSELRQMLSRIFAGKPFDPTELLPDLGFESKWFSGQVEFVEGRVPRNLGNLHFKIGAMLGLWCWLGLTDLHVENIIFREIEGKVLFFPIDVEAMFFNLTNLHDTLLTQSPRAQGRRLAGLSILRGYIFCESEVELIQAGTRSALALLVEYEGQKSQWIEEMAPMTPLRVILRGTQEYHDFLLSGDQPAIPLLDCEMEQLKRGDIPYFFKFRGQDEIYFLTSKELGYVAVSETCTYHLNDRNNHWAEWSHEKKEIFCTQLGEFLNQMLVENPLKEIFEAAR